MKTILIILSMAAAFGQVAVLQDTDLVSGSRVTINNNFALLDAKIIRMAGTPQANSIACSSSANLGVFYLDIAAGAAGSTLYICEKYGLLAYGWRGPYATSSSGGIIHRGDWSDTYTYAIQDAVQSGGSSYVAIAAHTNSPPPSAFWTLLAAAGSGGGGGGSYTFASPLTTSGSNIGLNQSLLSIGWSQLTGLPSTFAPSSHTHGDADITALAYSKLTGVPSLTPTTRNITAGSGLTGGGDLSADRTITLNLNSGSSQTCSGTDKFSAISALGIVTCTPDQTGAGGSGITTLNTLTATTQSFAIGSAGTDATWSSATDTHTLNLPSASASNRGLLTAANWSTFNAKQNAITGAPGTWPSFATVATTGAYSDLSGLPTLGSAAAQNTSAFEVPLTVTGPITRTGNAIGLDTAAVTLLNGSVIGSGVTISGNAIIAGTSASVVAAGAALANAATNAATPSTIVLRDGSGQIPYAQLSGAPLSDPAAGTAGLRTLGTGPQQAVAGNDARLNSNLLTNTLEVVSSGSTFTPANRTRRVFVNPASLLPTLAITLPAVPQDGDQCLIFFGGTISGGDLVVTSLSLVPNSGQSIVEFSSASNAVSGDLIQYEYSSATLAWHRIQ